MNHEKILQLTKSAVAGIKASGIADDLLTAAPFAAAGLPFLGAIGKDKIHDTGQGEQHKNFKNFSKTLKPGDVLLSGHAHDQSANKFFISLGTGTPKGYHSEVVDKVKSDGSIITNDMASTGYRKKPITSSGVDTFTKTERVMSAFRPVDSKVGKEALNTYRARISTMGSLEKKLTDRGISAEQAKGVVNSAFTPASKGTHVAVRELFLPYLSKNTSEANAELRQGKKDLGHLTANLDSYADEIATSIKSGKDPASSIPESMKGLCSSVVASSGFPVRAKQRPSLATPADVLRSKDVTPVSSYEPENQTAVNKVMNPALAAAPNVVRGAVGLGLGAATMYGINKFRAAKALNTVKVAGEKEPSGLSFSQVSPQVASGLVPGAITGGVAYGLKLHGYNTDKDLYNTRSTARAALSQAEYDSRVGTGFRKKIIEKLVGKPDFAKTIAPYHAFDKKTALYISTLLGAGTAAPIIIQGLRSQVKRNKARSKTASDESPVLVPSAAAGLGVGGAMAATEYARAKAIHHGLVESREPILKAVQDAVTKKYESLLGTGLRKKILSKVVSAPDIANLIPEVPAFPKSTAVKGALALGGIAAIPATIGTALALKARGKEKSASEGEPSWMKLAPAAGLLTGGVLGASKPSLVLAGGLTGGGVRQRALGGLLGAGAVGTLGYVPGAVNDAYNVLKRQP